MKVGITGGIGSGKTTVCRLFETLGIPVYYADARAKALMQEDDTLRGQIGEAFGKAIYQPDGQLDRAALARIVFKDKKALEHLNRLVHPAVAKDAAAWHEQQDSPYTLKEAALLYESGSYRALDKVIEVFAPVEVRIDRVMQRDGVAADQVKDRMRNQWPEWKKIIAADYVILNHNNHPLIPQVWTIHHRLLKL